MAWEDRTPFDAIEKQFSINERQIIALMRRMLQPSSFRNWRKRVAGRKTKHTALRGKVISRAYSPSQYKQRVKK